jgi:hypothetical protein
MQPSKVELLVGLISIVIFFYRMFVVMFPLLIKSIKEKDYGNALNSLTLLV